MALPRSRAAIRVARKSLFSRSSSHLLGLTPTLTAAASAASAAAPWLPLPRTLSSSTLRREGSTTDKPTSSHTPTPSSAARGHPPLTPPLSDDGPALAPRNEAAAASAAVLATGAGEASAGASAGAPAGTPAAAAGATAAEAVLEAPMPPAMEGAINEPVAAPGMTATPSLPAAPPTPEQGGLPFPAQEATVLGTATTSPLPAAAPTPQQGGGQPYGSYRSDTAAAATASAGTVAASLSPAGTGHAAAASEMTTRSRHPAAAPVPGQVGGPHGGDWGQAADATSRLPTGSPLFGPEPGGGVPYGGNGGQAPPPPVLQHPRDRPRWSYTPERMQAPFNPNLPKDPRRSIWAVNEDPVKLDGMYAQLLGPRHGPRMLQDEVKWLAVTHKSFDQGRRGFNDKLAYYGRMAVVMECAGWIVSEHGQNPRRRDQSPLDRLDNLSEVLPRDLVSIERMERLGMEVGLDEVVRWKPKDPQHLVFSGIRMVLNGAIYAIVGAVYLQQGALVGGKLIRERILKRLQSGL